MSRVWIINQYSSTPETGMAGRHYYLSRELAKRGHDVTLVAASWHHLLIKGTEVLPGIELRDGFRFFRVPVRQYENAHDKKRILNWLRFGLSLPQLPRQLSQAPDTILYSSPSLLGFLGAERLARSTGARLVFEVRDIWPLTLRMVGGYSRYHPFIALLQFIEDRAYRLSHAVISNLPNAVEHMETRGMDRAKFCWIPNGYSLQEVEPPDPLDPATAALLPKNKFLIGYTGTIGAANSLETLVAAAEKLIDQHDIAFVIVGQGRARDHLAEEIARRRLNNITLIDSIPKRQIQSMLRQFDACLICWRNSPLYQFGIAANKIPEYLYSGRPTINCYSGYDDPIFKYEAGLGVEAENPEALAAAVLSLRDQPQEKRAVMGAHGRKAAIQHYEYGALADKLERVLFP